MGVTKLKKVSQAGASVSAPTRDLSRTPDGLETGKRPNTGNV